MAFIGTLWNNRLAFCKNPTIVYKCANRFLTKGSKAESQYVASTGGSLLLIGQDGQTSLWKSESLHWMQYDIFFTLSPRHNSIFQSVKLSSRIRPLHSGGCRGLVTNIVTNHIIKIIIDNIHWWSRL